MPFPSLSKAPITEALLDIRTNLEKDTNVELLQSLQEQIKADYPNLNERRAFQSSIRLNAAGPLVKNEDLGVDGYFFSSSDKLQIVQFRLDGFSFSRLKPYQNWDSLRDEAKRLWAVYKAGAKVSAVRRLAVRYINHIEVGVGDEVGDYLKNSPVSPVSDFKQLTGFIYKQAFNNPGRDINIVVTLAMENIPTGVMKSKMIVDLDASKTILTSPRESDIWDTFEHLREAKNQAFFGVLTNRGWRKYE